MSVFAIEIWEISSEFTLYYIENIIFKEFTM